MNSNSRPSVDANRSNWQQASSQWSAVRPPLKPSGADIAFSEFWIARRSTEISHPLCALLLGVTPELAACAWPANTELTAVDISQAMIDSLWPAPGTPVKSQAICADWRELPLASASVDLMVGDGCFALLPYPAEARRFCAEAQRVLAPEGLLITRVFLRPDTSESLEQIRADLAAGKIGSVHVLKWRIAAAVQASSQTGAYLADVWFAWCELKAATADLLGLPGWSEPEIASLQRYRDNPACYVFLSLAEFRALVAPEFEELAYFKAEYELGERCPSFALRRRA